MKLRIVGLGDSTTAGTPGFLSRLKPLLPDGLHPDVSGYRKMGETLMETIERNIKSL